MWVGTLMRLYRVFFSACPVCQIGEIMFVAAREAIAAGGTRMEHGEEYRASRKIRIERAAR